MTSGITRLAVKPFLPFLPVFLDDMDIVEVQVNDRGAEPIMAEYFLDRCEWDALLQCRAVKVTEYEHNAKAIENPRA
jgi:hypothetical protein